MTSSYKPKGYNSVSIYMMAGDPCAVIDFVTATFDARSLRRFVGPDGSLFLVRRS